MNVLMYAAPLNVARVVVATESVEFMPLGLTLGTLACSASWTTYALLVGDATILARATSSATRSASPRSSSTRATPAPSPPRRPRPTAAA